MAAGSGSFGDGFFVPVVLILGEFDRRTQHGYTRQDRTTVFAFGNRSAVKERRNEWCARMSPKSILFLDQGTTSVAQHESTTDFH